MKADIELKDVPTYRLCEELECREGVETVCVEPHESTVISVEGCAVVFIVVD